MKPPKRVKKVKGYVYKDFMNLGWRGNDGVVIVYRYRSKSEKHMLPITITFQLPKI